MKKAFKLLVFSVIALMLFSICVLADTVKVTPSTAEDIDSAISSANDGDTVEIDLVKDMDVSKTLSIDKAIALVVNFNGYQLNYTGTGSYFIGLTNALATITLNGSNPMSNPSDYTHYSDSVKPDMKGNNSLIYIEHGTLNINNAYLLGSNNGWIVNAPIKDNNDTLINISGSVLRMPQGSSYSAISSEGANQSSKLIVRRALVANSSVLYGGFKGRSYNFNFTAGTSFTNVKFYDFKIANDSWYDTNDSRIAALMMNSFESAVMLDGCVFKNYDETLGNVDVVTGTGKQNIKLLNCTFDKVTGSLGSDRGGSGHSENRPHHRPDFLQPQHPAAGHAGSQVRAGCRPSGCHGCHWHRPYFCLRRQPRPPHP